MRGKNGQALFPSRGGCLISFLRQSMGHLSLGKLDRLSMAMAWAVVFTAVQPIVFHRQKMVQLIMSYLVYVIQVMPSNFGAPHIKN